MTWIGSVVAAAALVMLTFLAPGMPHARAADLTGIWIGEQKCDRFNGVKFKTPFLNDIMVITQQGQQINMAALFNGEGFNLVYQGHVFDDAKDPAHKAEAAFTECQTAPGSIYQEVGRATKVDLKANGKGSFDATSIFYQFPDDQPADTGTCSWSYKRVDTTDPGVPSCSEITEPTGIQAAPNGARRP